MAELVGLIASIVQLAGAAATVSLTLYECGQTVSQAKTELNDLANEVSDLSTVLEYLNDVLEGCRQSVIARTVSTIETLVSRCKATLNEILKAAKLVEGKNARWKWLFRKPRTLQLKLSLEGFKSNLGLVIQTLALAKTLQKESERFVKPFDSEVF